MTAEHATDFSALMPKVAPLLCGKLNKALSKGSRLRFGTHGSMEIDATEGWFDDHESKAKGGVLDLIQHKRGCDMHGALTWLEEQGLKEKREAARTFYDYADTSGAVAYRVERRGKGHAPPFLQHGPDGRGGFHAAKGCMQGVPRLPYRLPQLQAADRAHPVFIVEGEKDVDRLASLGLTATTNSGGAGKFGSELAPYFAGRRVIVIPDNDQPGRDHANDIATKLTGVASAIAVLPLPVPEKGDVSDWLARGGSVTDLIQKAEQALIISPSKGKADAAFRSGISAAALMAMQFEPIHFVVNGYIAEGLTVFAGAPKIGKSWLALNIAVAVAGDRPAFGTVPCVHGDVLYLALEDNCRRIKSRLLKMGLSEAPERLTFCTSWPSLGAGAVAEVAAWAHEAKNPVLVIVDVLAKVRDPANGRDSVINTDRRTYHLELRATPATYMASVSWTYPQDQLIALQGRNAAAAAAAPAATGIDVSALNFRYRIEGDRAAWKPVRAFDDGRQVFVEFPAGISQGEMPPLFVTGAAGDAELVNYRVQGRYMVVDRLFAAAELRLGDRRSEQRVRIVRNDGRRGGRD